MMELNIVFIQTEIKQRYRATKINVKGKINVGDIES